MSMSQGVRRLKIGLSMAKLMQRKMLWDRILVAADQLDRILILISPCRGEGKTSASKRVSLFFSHTHRHVM
jgi:hypothetical protein